MQLRQAVALSLLGACLGGPKEFPIDEYEPPAEDSIAPVSDDTDADTDPVTDTAVPLEVRVPHGTLAILPGADCPKDWSPHEASKGRYLVAVSTVEAAGAVVGTALGPDEVREHSHGFTASLDVPASRGLSALSGCCNDDPVANGVFDTTGTTDDAYHGFPTQQRQVCAKDLDSSTADGDPMPVGSTLFFDRPDGCPEGWAPYTSANGRVIVGLGGGGTPGTLVGAALQGFEVVTHTHDFELEIDISARDIAAFGGSNSSVGAEGPVVGTGSADAADPGIPYYTALVCTKVEDITPEGPVGYVDEIPEGMIHYFDDDLCPVGWTPDNDHAGRTVVALMDGGTPGLQLGLPLAPGEAPSHDHGLEATFSLPAHEIALVSGCCFSGPGDAGTYTATTLTDTASVDLPYVQLLACARDAP